MPIESGITYIGNQPLACPKCGQSRAFYAVGLALYRCVSPICNHIFTFLEGRAAMQAGKERT